MFLANNTVFWVQKACYEIFRLNIYSYQRLCCEKNVHLFIWNTNTVYLKKNQMAYGMHLNLFCKSLACLCLKCLHIVIC